MATPTEVHLHQAEHALDITWDDGGTTRFALAYLRGWCPCAHCQGHFAAKMVFQQGKDATLRHVEPVGGYAMRLHWGDGHQSGIYAFEYLRRIAVGPPDDGPTNEELLG